MTKKKTRRGLGIPKSALPMLTNGYITAKEATRFFIGPPSADSTRRWMRYGVWHRPSKRRIKLKSVRVGGVLFTRQEWITQFKRLIRSLDRRDEE